MGSVMTVRVGIIGVGIMGADHARTLATQVPGGQLQAVQDADAGRMTSVAAETGAARTIGDPLALIADASIDAVIIASPDKTHREFTLACIAAGKPVLCEKPLAPTARECLEIVAAESKRGRRLVQTGYMRRFDPAYVELKAKLRSGDLGAALIFHCVHRNVSAPAWFDSKMAIGNSAVHEFDIARWMLDSELTSVRAFKPKGGAHNSAGAPVFLVLEAASGQLVNIEVFNNATYGYDVRGEIVGEKGTASLRAPVRIESNLSQANSTAYPLDWRPWFADAYRIQLQAWIKSIESGVPVGASAWDGYAAAAVAEAGQLALEKKDQVAIRSEARPALYN